MSGISVLINLVITITAYTIKYLTTPKPPKVKPASQAEVNITIAGNGQPIPKVYGTTMVGSAIVMWFGFRTVAIKI